MKKGQRLWSKEELTLAINLYCKLPFGKLHKGNPSVIKLAELIGRTPSSVAFKLVNFASLDPSLQARGIKGAVNTSKLDKEVWEEFYLNWEKASYESEELLARFENRNVESSIDSGLRHEAKRGEEKEVTIKARVNQSFFRKTVLASYNFSCCITGINIPQFLVAGHIRPWSLDKENRLNPRNGLSMNYLHDKAFECGLITIDTDYKIHVSRELKKKKNSSILENFIKYDGKEIVLPTKFLPDTEFLKYHNNERFLK